MTNFPPSLKIIQNSIGDFWTSMRFDCYYSTEIHLYHEERHAIIRMVYPDSDGIIYTLSLLENEKCSSVPGYHTTNLWLFMANSLSLLAQFTPTNEELYCANE